MKTKSIRITSVLLSLLMLTSIFGASTVSAATKEAQTLSTESAQKNAENSNLETPLITGLKKTANGMQLEWKTVNGAEKYRVFVKIDGKWKSIGDTANTSFTDSNVLIGDSYTYTVRCVSADGKKFTSSYDAAGVTDTFIINSAAPQVTKLENTAGGVKLTWKSVPFVKNYRVFILENGSWKGVGNTNTNSFVHKGAQSDSTYTYTVRALKSDGKTLTGEYNKTGWRQQFIAQPSISSFANEKSGAKISWKKVTGAAKYRVFVKNGDSWSGIGSTTGTSLVHKGAKSGSTYRYTVRCQNADGSQFTSSYNNNGWTNQYIGEPAISSLSNTGKAVKISWGKITGAAKYRVFVKNGSSWKGLGDTTATSYTHNGVKNNVTYTYTVRCVSSDGKKFTSSYNGSGKSIKAVVKSNSSSAPSGYAVYSANGMTVTYPKTADRGEYATVKLKGAARTSYRIEVRYNSGVSKASGLGTTTTDANGNASWKWKIGASTTPGTYPITIYQGSKWIKVNFTVK